MRKEQIAIGRFETNSAAARFAKSEAMRRMCCCAVRRTDSLHFDVIAYQTPPIKDLLLLAMRAGLIDDGTHPEVLRRVSQKAGLSPAGWTFVSRHGLRAFEPALQPIFGHSVQFLNALRLIEWQARAKLSEPLPNALAAPFVVAMGILIEDKREVDPRLACAAVEHWIRLDELSQEQFAEQEWLRVLVWMRDHDPQLEKSQWRAGWSAILRQYLRWASLQPQPNDWESPLGDFTIGPWKVRSLDSAVKLAHEGLAMKHCIASYADRCHAGEYRAFSVSDVATAVPLATVGIELEGGEWQLDQIKGKSNSDPQGALLKVARSVLDRYRRAAPPEVLAPGSERFSLSLAC